MAKPKPKGLLGDYIPEPAGLGQPQSAPPLGLLGTAENVSMGLGRGVTNQLAGMLGMIQNPGAVVNSLYSLARTPPNQLAQMAVSGVQGAARNALAGPLGFGEFVGNNISPRSLLPTTKVTRDIAAHHGTPEFKDWFDGSKVVDDGGKPVAVYHGTGADFDEFAPNESGIFFGSTPDPANVFSKVGKGATPSVIPAYLSIKKPWTIVKYGDDVPYSKRVDQSVPALKAAGYDGAFRPEDGAWIVFDPKQVKSAVGNRGTYSKGSAVLTE